MSLIPAVASAGGRPCRQLEEQLDPGGSQLRSEVWREKEGARFGFVRAFGAAFSLVLKALVGLSFSKRSSSGGLSHSFPWEAGRSARATVWARSPLSRLFRGCVAKSPLSLVAHPRELSRFRERDPSGKSIPVGQDKGTSGERPMFGGSRGKKAQPSSLR